MRAGEVITAEVVRIDQNFVVVNAGLKSESFIPVEEFRNDRGELEAKPATSSPSPSRHSKTATANPPVARQGQAHRRLERPREGAGTKAPWSRASSPARSRAA
jgi:hypothetical protein